jgi:hypothetical protein
VVVTNMGRVQRVHAQSRVISRWLLPAAGTALGILLSAQAAHATADSADYSGPVNPTTADTLSWTITATPGDTLSCAVLVDATPTGGGACTTASDFHAAATSPGSYVLEVTDTTDSSTPFDSSPVTVVAAALPAPGQPSPSAPTPNPDGDTSPLWSLGLTADSSDASCTVTDANDVIVAGPATCSGSTWTSDLGSSARTGDYTLTVIANGDGVTAAGQSTPGTATYTLGPPGAVTVSAPGSTGPDTTPDFTITEAGPTAASFTCTLTLPDGSTTPLTTGCAVGTLTPTLGGGQGAYQLTVDAADALGNTASDTASYLLDSIPPTAPTVTGPTTGTHNSRQPDFAVTEPDGDATVTCTVTGPDPAAAVSACGATATLDLSAVTVDGIYTLHVTAKDAAGNAVTASVTYDFDSIAPTAPTVTGPTTGTHNSRQPDFAVTEPDGDATVTCTVTGPDPAAAVSACGATATLDLSAVTVDGIYTLHVTAKDAAGNAVTTSVTYDFDSIPPPAPSVSPQFDPTRSTSPSVTMSDGDTTAGLSCVLTGPDGLTVFTGTCPVDGVFHTGSHGEGTYSLVVTATDPAGNTSTRTVTWVQDTIAPPSPDVQTPPALTRNMSVTLTIGDTEGGVALTCLLTGPSGETVYSGTCPANGTFATNGHIDGLYTLVVTAKDAAGNTSTTTVSWTRDSTPPPTPTVTPPASPTRTTQPILTISDSEQTAALTCVLTAPDGTVIATGACPADGQFDTTAYGDGTYTLVVTATDAANNTSTRTVTWLRDTNPPPAPTVSAPPTLTNSKTVTLTIGDTESGVTLTCLVTGPVGELVSSGVCPVSGTFTTNGHVDGTFTLVVTATDAAGNFSTTTVSWVRDTTPPPAPTVSAPPPLTRNTAVTLTVSDSEGGVTLTCVLTGPGGTVSSGPCPGNGVFDTVGHGDGTYTLVVTSTDAAGNSSTTTVSWVRDTTPPPTPTVVAPADPNNAVHPIVGISDGESGVTLSCVLSGPAGTAFSGACPPAGSFNTTGFGDGTYTLVVTAIDAAGNTSTTTVTWVRDTLPPPAPDVSSPPALTRFRTVTLTIGDTEAGVALTCVVTDPAGNSIFSGACPASGSFNTGTAVDGTYSLTVTATDAAGNTSSTTVTWVQDTTPPPAPQVTTPAALTNSVTVNLTINDTESDAVVTCVLTGPGGATLLTGACPAGGVFGTTGHGDGIYTLVVTATDPAGNTTTTTVTWVRDTTPPVTPVVTAPESPAQGRSPSFAVTEPESPVTWSCSVDGPSVVPVSACGPTVVLDLSSAADGVYTVTVIAIDPAGNPSLAGTATYTLDTTPPPAPIVSAPPALTKSTSTTVTSSDGQSDAVLTCVLTAPDGRTVFSGACPAGGSFVTTGFVDGIYSLTVTATDSAGNFSTTTVTWRRDTIPPPVPVVSAPSSPGNTRAPAFPVDEPEAPVTYTCTVTGPSTVTVTACGPTVTLDLSSAADGTYTVFVTATDPAGNQSLAGSVSWVLDTIAPPAPTVTAPRTPDHDRSPTFTVTDTESGVQWICNVTGPGSATIASCGPATVLDLSTAPDGTYTVTVSAVDAAGNVSAVGTATYTLDTTPPPAPAVTAPASPSHDLTPTYGISDGENGVTLTCVLTGPNGNTVFTGGCPADGTFDTSSRGDGLYTLTVTATDAAGNSSSTTVTWTRDTVAPPAPGVSAPASPAQGRTVSFTVTDSEAGVTYTCTVSGPSGASVTSCGPNTVVNLSGSADGTYTLTVTATDAAANTSSGTSASYILDTTAPTTPTVSATPSPSQGKHATFTIGGVETNGVMTCTLSGPAGASAVMGGPCGPTVGVDLTGQPDGTYTLTVTVTDSAGNISPAGGASYTLDTTAPTVPSVSAHASPGNDRKPSFGVTTEPNATLTCTVARYFQVVASGLCGPGGSVDLSGYEDGEFEITISATDAAGNAGPPTTVVYVLDTTAPDAPVLTSPASPSPIERPVWVFTAEDGTTTTCTITGPGGQVVQGPVACTSPFTGVFKNLPDGTYVLTVVATDAAGNASAPATSAFVLDRHAPVPPTVLPPSSPNSSHHPAWTISAPRGATVTCTLMNGKSVIFGPDSCPTSGVLSLAGMPDGTYTLRVTATDTAGNVSATSVTTYVLDTSRPSTPDLDYSSGSSSTDVHPYWGFALPAGTVGRCELVHDGTVIASRSNCKGAVSFDLTGRPLGTYTLRVYAIDAAGNVSRPLVASYVLGARQPSPPPSGQPGGSPGGVPFGGGGGGGTGSHHGGNGPALGARQVAQVLQQFTQGAIPVRTVVKKAAQTAHHVASSIIPVIHDQVTEHVSKAVQGVVNAVSHAGGGTGFPLLLLIVVAGFLLMQNRIDRRDPKLALASVAADDTVEFQRPPSRRAPRTNGNGAER